MRLTFPLLLALLTAAISAAEWDPATQAAIEAAQREASWTWRAARIAEIERCQRELSQLEAGPLPERFPIELRDTIRSLLVAAVATTLQAPPPADPDGAPPTEVDTDAAVVTVHVEPSGKAGKGRIAGRFGVPRDATSFLIRALVILHAGWDQTRTPPSSKLAREVLSSIDALVESIDRTTTRRLEENLNAVAHGKTVPHDVTLMLQSLIYMPLAISACVNDTSDLDRPWSKAQRAFAKERADRWLALANQLLAMESYEDTEYLNLTLDEGELRSGSFIDEPLTKLARWEAQQTRHGAHAPQLTLSPKRQAQLEQLEDDMGALVPTGGIPTANQEALALVERLHVAEGLCGMISDLIQLVERENGTEQLILRVRAAGRLDEAHIAELTTQRDAQVDAALRVGRDHAMTRARLAMLTYKAQFLEHRKDRVAVQHRHTLSQLEDALSRTLNRTDRAPIPGADGIETDIPADHETSP